MVSLFKSCYGNSNKTVLQSLKISVNKAHYLTWFLQLLPTKKHFNDEKHDCLRSYDGDALETFFKAWSSCSKSRVCLRSTEDFRILKKRGLGSLPPGISLPGYWQVITGPSWGNRVIWGVHCTLGDTERNENTCEGCFSGFGVSSESSPSIDFPLSIG